MTNRNTQKASAQKTVLDIRRATRKRYSAEEKIRIVRFLYVLNRTVLMQDSVVS